MREKVEKEIKEEIKKLPEETRQAINSFDWKNATKEIGKKYLNDESDIGILQAEVGMVLAGIDYGNSLPANIEEDMDIAAEDAKKIAAELDITVFKPIYRTMESMIKESLKNKGVSWKQNVKFVLSNGDWTVFQNEPEETATPALVGAAARAPYIPSGQDESEPKINTDFISQKNKNANVGLQNRLK